MTHLLYRRDPPLSADDPIEVSVPYEEGMPPVVATLFRDPEGSDRGSVILGLRSPDDDLGQVLLEGRARVFPQEAIPAIILALKMIHEVGEAEVVWIPEALADVERDL